MSGKPVGYDGLGLAMLGLATLIVVLAAVSGFIHPPTPADDSSVQLSMAWASWVMVWVSAGGGAIGGLSLYLIYRTLQAAQRSAVAAENALVESRRIADETRDLGQKQVRAYMVITAVGIEPRPGPPTQLAVTIRLRNSGQSPATMLSVTFQCLLKFSVTDEPTEWVENVKYRADLASGEGDEVNFSFLIPRQPGPWQNQWRRAEASVQAKYLDVFDQWQTSGSRFIWDLGTERQFDGDWLMSRRASPSDPAKGSI